MTLLRQRRVRPFGHRAASRAAWSLAGVVFFIASSVGFLAVSAGTADPRSVQARRVQAQPYALDGSNAADLDGLSERAAAVTSSPPMTVHVGSALVEWNAPDGSDVAGVVLRDGVKVAYGKGHSHMGGWLSVNFSPGGLPAEPADGGEFAIQPGDVVRLEVVSGSLRAEAVVPPLAARVDTEAGLVRGESEPGQHVHVEFAHEDDRFLWTMHAALFHDAFENLVPPEPRPGDVWTVEARSDGHWDLDLGERNPGPGDFVWVSTLDGEGHRFVLDLAIPAQYLRDDGLLVSVGPPGSVQSISVRGADGGILANLETRHQAGSFHWGIRHRYFSVGSGSLELPRPLEAGDRISITTRSAPSAGGTVTREEIALPPVAIDFQRDGTLAGMAPPDEDLWLGIRGPDGQSLTETLRTDATGRWSSDAPLHVNDGWKVTAATEVEETGLHLLRTKTESLVRVMSGTPFLVIHPDLRSAPPFQPESDYITVTLRGPDGSLRGRGAGHAYNGYGRELWPERIGIKPPDSEIFDQVPPFVTIRPGDQLEIELIPGDPVVLRVPRFEATIDEPESELSLHTSPVAQVSLALLGPWDGTLRGHEPVNALRTDADAAGHAALDLSTLVQADPGFTEPYWGIASLALQPGVEVATGFARATVTVDLDSGELRGFGPPWQSAELELFDADGRLRGSDGMAGRIVNRTGFFYGGRWGHDSTSWDAQLVDAAGQPVRPNWGDELLVRFGAEPWRVDVPLLEAVVFAEEDRMEGRGPAGSEVVVSGGNYGSRWQHRVQTDDQGRFGLDLGAEGVDVNFGDAVELRTREGRITLTGSAISPGLTLDLDRGSLRTNVGAMRAVTTRLRSDGRLLASTVHRSRPDGSHRTLFDPGMLASGHEISIETRSHGDLRVSTALHVPDLSIEPDPARGEVRIHAPPGMLVSARISPSPGQFNGRDQVVPQTGTFLLRGDDDAPLDLRPGTVIRVTLRTEEGHSVLRQTALPEISVPVGGAWVCGWTDPGTQIVLRAHRDGTELGGGNAVADRLGRFSFLVRDDRGVERYLEAGDRVVVSSEGAMREHTLPPLRGVVNLAESTVFRGSASPGSHGVLRRMDRPDCMQWSGRPSGHSWTADEEGAIVGGGQGPLAIQGIDISFYAHTVNALGSPAIFDLSLKHQDGIRVYRLLRELRADIFANTPEVRGEASAGDVVSLSLRGPQGQVRADALAVADSDGLWAAHWRDDAGQDIRPDVGDRVVVESGPSSAEIEVLPLGFDRIGDRLVGTAPPGSTVWLRYTLSPSLFGGEALGDEPHVTTVLVDTDETGRFEIPLKSEGQGWTEEDLVSIRASLRLEGRHEIVEEWFRPPDLGEAPTRSYLPWTSVRR